MAEGTAVAAERAVAEPIVRTVALVVAGIEVVAGEVLVMMLLVETLAVAVVVLAVASPVLAEAVAVVAPAIRSHGLQCHPTTTACSMGSKHCQ